MNEAKRRALVAITRQTLGMPEQPSACCPAEPAAETADEKTRCCAAPTETALNETPKRDGGNVSEQCCTP